MLVGSSLPSPVDATEYDASMMYYTEGYRVSVNEGVFNARHHLGDSRFINMTFTYDIMTGASPNGALASLNPQTFTRASGKGGYVIRPEALPLDDTFQDNRVAAAASIESPISRNLLGVLGAHVSMEYDYFSAGANARFVRDFNKRNTSLAASAAIAWDVLSPEGGVPTPFSSMQAPGDAINRMGDTDQKSIADFLIGITQVINRSTLARLNYGLSYSSGYHTDPYKLVTVANTTLGAAYGDPVDYLFERRPDTRLRQTVYGIVKHHLSRDVIEASYRYGHDDWGVQSHTVEARYRWQSRGGRYLQPQWRYYHQRASDHSRYFLRDDEPIPEFATADYRLGNLSASTVSLKYGMLAGDVHEVNIRIGYYRQMGDSSPPEAFGSLQQVDLFPRVDAWIIQIGYSAFLDV